MSGFTDSELLDDSCSPGQLLRFPNNLVHLAVPQHQLDSYRKLMDERKKLLFCEDGAATLDILEYDDHVKGKELSKN
jgi:hypothetical protein